MPQVWVCQTGLNFLISLHHAHQLIWLIYLVQGHTLKSATDGSIIFFFPGYVNEIPLPNPGLRLYKSRGYTFELQPIEVPRRSSVSGKMTRSRSRNAAMDMPSLQPQAFMVMQVMHPLLGQPDPRPDSSPVGTDISRNLKLEVHHGRAVADLSGINPDE